MSKKRGIQVSILYTKETHGIITDIAKKENKKLPNFIINRLIKLCKKIDDEAVCLPCEMELSQQKRYGLELPLHLTTKMECLSQRLTMTPGVIIQKFIIDPEIAKYYEEKGEF